MDGRARRWGDRLEAGMTRRRLLRRGTAAGVALAGAWLAACGGGKEGGQSGGVEEKFQGAGVANTATVGTAKVERSVGKRGGRMVGAIGEPDSFDPHRDAGFPGVQVVNGVYSTLWRGYIPPGQSPIIEGDLVQSYEQPDNLSLVMKFPAGVKWQNVRLENGREFSS